MAAWFLLQRRPPRSRHQSRRKYDDTGTLPVGYDWYDQMAVRPIGWMTKTLSRLLPPPTLGSATRRMSPCRWSGSRQHTTSCRLLTTVAVALPRWNRCHGPGSLQAQIPLSKPAPMRWVTFGLRSQSIESRTASPERRDRLYE
jgi:hypothetical protein